MLTDKLTGALLDLWVAKAEGVDATLSDPHPNGARNAVAYYSVDHSGKLDGRPYMPSAHWCDGGPIIEREKIDLMHVEYRPAMGGKPAEPWNASMQALSIDNPDWDTMSGTTALEAAMRAYVASKFGDDVPDDPLAAPKLGEQEGGKG